jgi:hypothetical protein
MPNRQSASSALELWREINVDGIFGWRCSAGGMAWAYGYEGLAATFT